MGAHQPSSLGLYVHIPFCRVRCSYCDFNTYAGLEDLMPAYVDALTREMAWYGVHPWVQAAVVDTVYFGGGTPSLLPLPLWERLFDALHRHFRLAPEVEITVEANPETLTPDLLRGLRGLGVNRLSMGMQAVHPQDLRLLGRSHDFPTVIRAVALARRAGFDNLNLDLIFGLPGQPLVRWQEALAWALRLAPEHLSCYALTLEHGTPLQVWVRRGRVPPVDDDLAADMYLWALEALEQAGYRHYEISNWARGGHACRHNLKYWRYEPYLGLGAGAHGFWRIPGQGVRLANVLAPRVYIARLGRQRPPAGEVQELGSPAVVSRQYLTPDDMALELALMGLRLTREGLPDGRFREVVGRSLADFFADALPELRDLGLVDWDGRHLRLTRRGLLLANRVWVRLMEGR